MKKKFVLVVAVMVIPIGVLSTYEGHDHGEEAGVNLLIKNRQNL